MAAKQLLLRGAAAAFCASLALAPAIAECPEPDTIGRYIQTTQGALETLVDVIPASQYEQLDRNYAAMITLHWHHNGLEAIKSDDAMVARLMACFETESCGVAPEDPIDAQLVDMVMTGEFSPPAFLQAITESPSENMFTWAEIELECRPAPEEASDDETETLEADDEIVTVQDETPETAPPEGDALEVADVSAADDTGDVDEIVSPAPPPAIDTQELVATAAASIAAGNVENAIPLLTESCFYQASQSEQSLSCDTLLDILEARTTFGREEIAGSQYLEISEDLCELGYNRGCQNMATYLRAANTDGAYERGVAFTARSCDLGDAKACALLATDHFTGRTAAPDEAFARDRLQRACDLSKNEYCLDVADLYLRGVGGPVDIPRALDVVAMTCPPTGARDPEFCVSAADFVLIHMKSGEARAGKVREFTRRACDIGHGVGCAWYAEDLELGLGGSVDRQGARQARLAACEHGDQKSCNTRS